jgi:pimeloyl-ACP methyl ester carboxylesterase
MQVMQTFGHRKIFVIGKGWGGLIALLLIKHMQFDLAGLVLSDVALEWSLQADPLIREALQRDVLDFATLESAEAAVAASYEFRRLDARHRATMASSRLRQTQTGYSLHYDPALRQSLERLRGRYFNVSQLLESVASRLLCLVAEPLSEAHRTRLQEVVAGVGGGAIDLLAPGGRIHFDTPAQLLLVLGFLSARRLPTS